MNKNKIYFKGKIELKKNGDTLTVIASDETLDRQGDVLPIDQWDLSKFMASPRMLVDHNHQVASIVGKWANTRIEGRQLLMDAIFHDFTDLAKATKDMVINGFLDTVSVGFIYHEPTENGGRPSMELIETSWVTVPANPSARLKGMMEKDLSAEEEAKVKAFDEELESDDVLPDEEEEPIVDVDDKEEIKEIESLEHLDALEGTLEEESFVKMKFKVLKQFIGLSEQLKTLTEDKSKSEKAKQNALVVREALKEAAGIISSSLREMNTKL